MFTYIYFFQPFADWWGFAIDLSKPPASVNQPEGSASVYQGFYVTYTDGSSRWYWAQSRATSSLTLLDLNEKRLISTIQTNLYINVNFGSKTVTSWTFTATGYFHVLRADEQILRTFTQSISQTGSTLQSGRDTVITSATMSQDMNSLYSFEPTKIYHFRSQLRDMKIRLTFSDGASQDISIIGGTENDLKLSFTYLP